MLMKKTVSVSFLLAVTPKHLNAIITKDNIQPVSQITDKVCKRLLFHELSGSALFMDVPRLYS